MLKLIAHIASPLRRVMTSGFGDFANKKHLVGDDKSKKVNNEMEMRSYKYRIYPTKRQIDRLNNQLNLCQELYNTLLKKCKESYKRIRNLLSIDLS